MFRKTALILLLFTLLVNIDSRADDNVAIVLKVVRDVQVTPSEQARTVQARKGYVLRDGNKVATGAKSSCAIKFLDDKSLLRIRENSSCTIEGKKDQEKIEKNILVEVGTFFASLFQPKGSFKVTTPTSVASVKGTKFWVIQKSPTKYVVQEGMVELENETGKVLVREGQTAIVESQTSTPVVRLTTDDDIPSEEDGDGGSGDLDIEFENERGEQKTLRIKVQE